MNPTFPLLGLLLRGDTYGYELKRAVETEFAPYWQIDFAQLYRTLAKLHAAGWARVQTVSGEGGPARKIYRATARGARAFETWIQAPAITHDEFWVKARLAAWLGYDAERLLTAERKRLESASQLDRAAADSFLAEAAAWRTLAEREAVERAAVQLGSGSAALLIAGSDDPLLAQLAGRVHAVSRVTGSTAGLVTLAQHDADIAGTHLRDPETAEYNVPFVQHLIPEDEILLVNLAVREYGLMVAPGNPKHIRGVRDLARRNVRLLNRTRGAGARLWLLQHLRAAHIDPTRLRDWSHTVKTYAEIGDAILRGSADVGPGLRATAQRMGLELIPLGEERFDLAVPRALYESVRGAKLFTLLTSKEFRTHTGALPGYDLAQCGRVVAAIKYGSRK